MHIKFPLDTISSTQVREMSQDDRFNYLSNVLRQLSHFEWNYPNSTGSRYSALKLLQYDVQTLQQVISRIVGEEVNDIIRSGANVPDPSDIYRTAREAAADNVNLVISPVGTLQLESTAQTREQAQQAQVTLDQATAFIQSFARERALLNAARPSNPASDASLYNWTTVPAGYTSQRPPRGHTPEST